MYSQPDFYGSKYTGFQPAAQVSKQVRADLKTAQKAGEIPGDIRFSVKSQSYSMGQSVRVEVQGRSAERIWYYEDVEYPAGFTRPERRMHAEAKEIEKRVFAIANAYNRDRSDSMVDYFDVMYHCFAEWESDWSRKHREQRAAVRAARRAHKAA